MDRQLGGKLRAYPNAVCKQFSDNAEIHKNLHFAYYDSKMYREADVSRHCLENRGFPRDTKVFSALASMPPRWILLNSTINAISRRICRPPGCGSFWLKKECSSLGVSTRYASVQKFFLSFQKSSATHHMRIFRGSLKICLCHCFEIVSDFEFRASNFMN